MDEQILEYKKVAQISKKIDEYIDTANPGLEKYCRLQHDKKCKDQFVAAQLYYVIGTGYSGVHLNNIQKDWYSPNISKAVYFLRKALHELKSYSDEHLIKIITNKELSLSIDELHSRININLANYLTEQYRHVEALEFYDRAIAMQNAFGLATKARCLIKLNETVYDGNASFFFSKEIYKLTQNLLRRSQNHILIYFICSKLPYCYPEYCCQYLLKNFFPVSYHFSPCYKISFIFLFILIYKFF